MSISGLVVHARPEQVEVVQKRLLALEGVEIHGVSDAGKIVVTVDVENDHVAADTLIEMQKQEGVLSASLIYNHFEKSDEENLVEKEQVR